MNKQLEDKAIDIKGKKYVLVADRILYFNEKYPQGSIQTKLISEPMDNIVIVKAIVYPKPGTRKFTGYSQTKWGDGFINKTSALENAETSAVGRALAMMGIGVIESIASVDEINKATNQTVEAKMATPKQIKWLRTEAVKVSGLEEAEDLDNWMARKDVLGRKPQELRIGWVKSAIDKIQSLKEVSEKLDIVTTDIPDVINLDDIPY